LSATTPGTRAGWDQLYGPIMPAPTRRFMAAFFEASGNPDASAGEAAFMTRYVLLRAWGEFQETHPLIVAPVATEIPALAGTDLDDGQVAATLRAMRMATAVNALGLPAVALPVGVADGLPRAVQVVGPPFREDLCLDAGQAIEERLGILTPIDPR
jgi:amidase